LNGANLPAEEIREEAGRLVHHPRSRRWSVWRAWPRRVTPLILFVGVAIFLAFIAAIVMTGVFCRLLRRL